MIAINTKNKSFIYLILGLALIAILIPILSWIFFIIKYPRSKVLENISINGSQLAAALEIYYNKFNAAPRNIIDLCPVYINKLPNHGIREYGGYELLNGRMCKMYDIDFGISVNTPRAFLNWDEVVYIPLKCRDKALFNNGNLLNNNGWFYINE